MKTIPNKVTTLDGVQNENGDVQLLNYADLMKIVMNQPPPNGFSIADMRKNFRVLDAIDQKAEEISMEDSDFEHFKSKMKDVKWNISRKDLIQFEDDINVL